MGYENLIWVIKVVNLDGSLDIYWAFTPQEAADTIQETIELGYAQVIEFEPTNDPN